MIVVLEGPDCAGKTTLAEALTAERGTVRANGKPPVGRPLFEHYAGQVALAAGSPSELTVFDRLHVGELIYGPLFRGKSALSIEEIYLLEDQLDKAGAVKIHVDCSDEALLERYHVRGDELIKSPDIFLSNAAQYRELFASDGPFPGWIAVATDRGNPDIQAIVETRS